jgi:hypothetical protein
MLSSHDVLDVEGEEKGSRLRQVTIFTKVISPVSHQVLLRSIHLLDGLLFQELTGLGLKDRHEVKGVAIAIVFLSFHYRHCSLIGLLRQCIETGLCLVVGAQSYQPRSHVWRQTTCDRI